jgi:hypothetical protein
MSKLAALLNNAPSKFAASLQESKIDPVRVLHKSHELEALRPEDREIKRAKRSASGSDDEAAKAVRAKKPRSGRPVTDRLIKAAIAGQPVSGPAKQRLLRAVNAVRTQKGQSELDLRALF